PVRRGSAREGRLPRDGGVDRDGGLARRADVARARPAFARGALRGAARLGVRGAALRGGAPSDGLAAHRAGRGADPPGRTGGARLRPGLGVLRRAASAPRPLARLARALYLRSDHGVPTLALSRAGLCPLTRPARDATQGAARPRGRPPARGAARAN